jgi:cyclase
MFDKLKGDFEMKKKIEFVLMLALLLASNLIGRQRTQQPVELRKISDKLFEIVGGRGAQGGAYIGDDGVLVIDAKMDKASVDQVIEAIKRITDKPIKYLVNTHSDGDHVAGNCYFPESVTIVAHENCRKDFFLPGRNGAASQWTRPDLVPFVPSLTFSDKMSIHLGSKTVELWYFGVGHTTGDIVVYFPEEKTAFIGDQIFLARAQLIHSYKGGNSFEHVKTLTKMLDTIDAGKFCSGHSEMTNRAGIENHIGRMKKRQQKIKALIAQGKSTEEIKSEFEQSESRLVESICNEIKKSSR